MYLPAQKDPRGGHNRVTFNQQFFKKWTPSMAYVLGFIFADGAIEDVQKSSRTCYLSIGLAEKDLDHLEKIRDVMGSNHKFYKRIHPDTQWNNQRYLSNTVYTLRIGSKLLYNELLLLGVTPRKSLTITFPTVPKRFLSFFIRGYFDGDGCVYLIRKKYPKIVFTSGSIEFLKGLSVILVNNLKIPEGKIYVQQRYPNNTVYKLVYNNHLSRTIFDFMYTDLNSSPYLERKYLKSLVH